MNSICQGYDESTTTEDCSEVQKWRQDGDNTTHWRTAALITEQLPRIPRELSSPSRQENWSQSKEKKEASALY
jgi:hypothetical protein